MTGIRFKTWAATHVGTVRSHNEDAFVSRPDAGLWAVADGAGGHAKGEVASAMVADALEAIASDLPAAALLAEVRSRITDAHAALRSQAEASGGQDICATTVVVLIARDDHFACLWAGDSRGYLLRDGALTQITRDHSLVQELVDAGAITEAEAEHHPHANVITRAVGSEAEELELDKVTDRLTVGDRFLLCSDGLCKTLAERDLMTLLTVPGDVELADTLIHAALEHHVRDNVTAVVVEARAADI